MSWPSEQYIFNELYGDLQSDCAVINKYFTHLNIQDTLEYDWNFATSVCEVDGYRYKLGPRSPIKLHWFYASIWCRAIGGELPNSVIAEILMQRFKTELMHNEYYWTSETDNVLKAYKKAFGINSKSVQISNYVYSNSYAMAVKKELIDK
jgi:hypothetical protein